LFNRKANQTTVAYFSEEATMFLMQDNAVSPTNTYYL